MDALKTGCVHIDINIMKKKIDYKVVFTWSKTLTFSFMDLFKSSRIKILLAMFILMSSTVHSACFNCNQTVYLNINENLGLSDNRSGYTKTSSIFTVSKHDSHEGNGYYNQSFSDINDVVPPLGTSNPRIHFQKIDEYISVAVENFDSCGSSYAPFNIRGFDNDCKHRRTTSESEPTSFRSYIRIDKPLLGGNHSKRIYIGKYGWCKGRHCQTPTSIVANIYLNYKITVPQNCFIDAGEVISVNFGNIPSTAFKLPGKIAERVTPVTRKLTMQCTNIEPFRNMSVRVQANSVSGNAIVSNNKDVGFVLGDSSRRELTPNQPTSTIPFTLSGKNTASVPVTIWPVSVTGKTPVEGRVKAIGFLRVDFD